ncbi:MAG: hypothetical protein Q7K65_00150 [Candidatus Buchananbacteria bacterium]|nr:hypothetical protein [Candidatus Buchananbacteria bacterium]
MILSHKKLSKSFLAIIVIIIIIFIIGWLFWPNIKKLVLGNDYQIVTTPLLRTTIDKELKQKIISELSQLRHYGEWPISIDQANPNRGDPFKPKTP